MMRMIALLIFLFALPAGAETITVRSGDHAGFSRLVFPFSDPVEWQMGRVPGGYEIRFRRPDVRFDLSRVFRKITRERIRSLAETGEKGWQGLTIRIGCDCHADAFEFRPGLLVVDIKDGPPDENSVFEQTFSGDETALSAALPDTGSAQREAGDRSLAETDRPRQIFGGRLASERFRSPPTSEKTTEPVALPVLLEPQRDISEVLLPVVQPPEIREMGKDFLTIMSKAATEGLLTPNTSIPSPPQSREDAASGADAHPTVESEQLEKPEEAPEHRLPIRIRSSIDEVSPDQGEDQLEFNANGNTCLPESIFDLPSWGEPSDPYESVIRARAKLVGELDRVSSGDIVNLVRAYLYAGFGAEARNVISAFGQKPEHADVFLAMAEIMDDGWAFERSVLAGQISCETDGALWAALSLPEFPRGLEMNRQAIQRAFSALPGHTRRHLGPVLVGRFLAMGDEEMAHALKSAILRVADTQDNRVALMEADFRQGRNIGRTTERKLEEIVRSNDVLSAEALQRLLETRLENGEDISDELIAISAAMAYEREGSAIGEALLGLNILAMASRGRYIYALQEWHQLPRHSDIRRKKAEELLEKILEYATEGESDQEFLAFIYAAKDDLLHVETAGEAHEAAAARLIDLGFPEIGSGLLEMLHDGGRGHEMLRARAALAMNRPEEALALLEGRKGREFLELRAKAAEMLSRFDLAAALYEEAGNQPAFQSMLMKMRAWQRLRNTGSGPARSIAELATQDVTSDTGEGTRAHGEDGSLSEYREILKTSKAARIAMESLLQALPASPENGS